jgi:drug/metabolite transporter (DMT)-like permease
LSQAVRDVYFGRLFQSVDFFAVVVIAFLLSTVIFGGIVAVRVPAELARLRPHIPTVVAVNVTTALAWSCYFFALTHLEPAIVNTVHSGMAPLTVLALGACGVRLTKPDVLRRGERFAYAGIAVSVAALWHVVLSGYSSLPGASQVTSLVALAAVTISGSSITVSLLYCKRLQDRGISADTVTLVRYPLLVLLAGYMEACHGWMDGISGLDQLVTLAVAATALIVLPLFILQVGIGRTAPLTAHVIRALGPVCVFALQQIDGRLSYSTPTLLCVLAYSGCAIAGNVLHGWRDERSTPGHELESRLRSKRPASEMGWRHEGSTHKVD